MPKLVDYGARYALVQEAVYSLVLTEGVHALSRRSLARVLGISASTIHRMIAQEADLVTMAADEVAAQRRFALSWAPREESHRDKAVRTILDLVPLNERRAQQELVWLRLALATGLPEALVGQIAEDREHRTATLEGLSTLLDVPEPQRPGAIQDLHVLVDGLTWGVCAGALAPDVARTAVERTIDRLDGLAPER